jgi:hypothetical protein
MFTGLAAVTTALVVATGAGVAWQRRNGRFRATTAAPAPQFPPVWTRLGVTPGIPLTLVQFSSAFCAPCRATRVLCADVAATVPGMCHLDIDAESHLAEVRELNIWKTPTLLLVDAEGRERTRATGLPTRAQLVGAVATVLAPPPAEPVP